MLRKSISIFLSLVLILFFSGCMKKDKSSKEKESINILAIMSLTGQAKEFGQSSKNTLELLKDTFKKKGIKIIYYDDENSKDKITSELKELINKEKVKAILLCTQSDIGEAVAEIAAENKVIVINATEGSTSMMKKGKDLIYSVAYSDQFEGEALAQFTIENLKAKRAAVIYNEDNPYSREVADSYKSKLEKLGLSTVIISGYNKNTTDYSPMLNTIKGSSPEVLLIPDYYYKAGVIAGEVKKLQINSILLGTEAWTSQSVIGSSNFQGAYFSTEYSPQDTIPNTSELKQKYLDKYNVYPDVKAALTYDAAQILLSIYENPSISENSEKIKEKISKINMEGVTGQIIFNEERQIKKTATIVKIENGTVQIVNKEVP